jgi:hypothetical protein
LGVLIFINFFLSWRWNQWFWCRLLDLFFRRILFRFIL